MTDTDRIPVVMLDPEALMAGVYVLTMTGTGAAAKFTLQTLNSTPALVPLTTMIGGSPAFVFDSFGQCVMTEVPR